MKTLAFAQLGIDELTTQEMIDNHGGGDSYSLINIGDISVGNLVNINGNSLFSGANSLFSGNSTNTSPGTGASVSFSTSNS